MRRDKARPPPAEDTFIALRGERWAGPTPGELPSRSARPGRARDGWRPAAAVLQASANGTSTTVTVFSADTTTLALSDGTRDVAIWDEASFWAAFGGRSPPFTWRQ